MKYAILRLPVAEDLTEGVIKVVVAEGAEAVAISEEYLLAVDSEPDEKPIVEPQPEPEPTPDPAPEPTPEPNKPEDKPEEKK